MMENLSRQCVFEFSMGGSEKNKKILANCRKRSMITDLVRCFLLQSPAAGQVFLCCQNRGRNRMAMKLFTLGFSGAMGTIARYMLSETVQKLFGSGFPWGTFFVNMLGCFLVGHFLGVADHFIKVSGETRTFILIGFMGAFTTFSTYILETGRLISNDQWAYAFSNILLHTGVGFFALFFGFLLARTYIPV